MGNDFFNLEVPKDTAGRPYRGPREWLVDYDDEQNRYLKELLEQLYPAGIMIAPDQDTVHRLWPECPARDGFICPFCFAVRDPQTRGMTAMSNLHTHVLSKAEHEADDYYINSPGRLHDPAIFTLWNEYRYRVPNTNRPSPIGTCRACQIIIYRDNANHINCRFYCKTRNEGYQLRRQSEQAQRDVVRAREIAANFSSQETRVQAPSTTAEPTRGASGELLDPPTTPAEEEEEEEEASLDPPPQTTYGLFRDPRKSEKKAVSNIVRGMIRPEGLEYDPALEFQDIITKFRPAIPFGGTGRPRPISQMLKTVENVARSFKGSGRALRILTTAYERQALHKAYTAITDEQRKKTLEKFPAHPAKQIDVPAPQGGNMDSIHFEAFDIATIISRIPDGKGQGPSGLGSSHIRAIAKQVPQFAAHLARLGNQLLEEADAVSKIPALYRYRIQCIPKHTPGDFRPICVQEPILSVLHRHLARRLQDLIQVSEDQFCFRPSGRPLALRKAKQLMQEYPVMIQLDVSNAFGSIPHNQIIKQLVLKGPGPQIIAYIRRFLDNRTSRDLPGTHEGVGVPQGDPMSMFLFALGIDPVITQIRDELGGISAYADDIVIGLKPGITPAQAIRRAVEIYKEVGLEINERKCQISTDTNGVNFLGHPYKNGEPLTIAAHLVKKAEEKIKILTYFPELRRTAAYVMLNRSIVPALNYGPLVEQGNHDAALPHYRDIDQRILAALSRVLGLDNYGLTPEELRAFALACKE